MSPARPAFRRSAHRAGTRVNFARGLRALRAFGLLCAGLAVLALAAVPHTARAQAGFANDDLDILQGTQFGNQPTLFPNDGRVKLLALALSPTNVTESFAEQIGLILQKNLSNTGHFAVVGPRETNAMFENPRPDLVDCRQIACGVEMGKLIGAQKVLVGTLRRREGTPAAEGENARQQFVLEVRLIEIVNNLTDYEETIQFPDDDMDEALFRLANSISDNTLVVGRVLSTSIRGIVLNLGIKDGVKLGDFLVIYKEDVPIANLEGQEIDRQRKNIAIVKILRVNDNTSEALLAHSVEEPQVSHFAATYRNPTRQTLLVEDTRRELDTGIRLENKLRPLELAPVALADSARREWQQRMAYAEAQQNFWYTVTAVGGIASLVVLSNYEDTNQVKLILAATLGATGYGVVRSLRARDSVNELQTEGRAKGYLSDAGFNFNIGPDQIALSYNFKF